MNRLLGLLIIVSIGLISVRGWYIGELLISFLPYLVVVWVLIWVIAVHRMIRHKTWVRGILLVGYTALLARGA